MPSDNLTLKQSDVARLRPTFHSCSAWSLQYVAQWLERPNIKEHSAGFVDKNSESKQCYTIKPYKTKHFAS